MCVCMYVHAYMCVWVCLSLISLSPLFCIFFLLYLSLSLSLILSFSFALFSLFVVFPCDVEAYCSVNHACGVPMTFLIPFQNLLPTTKSIWGKDKKFLSVGKQETCSKHLGWYFLMSEQNRWIHKLIITRHRSKSIKMSMKVTIYTASAVTFPRLINLLDKKKKKRKKEKKNQFCCLLKCCIEHLIWLAVNHYFEEGKARTYPVLLCSTITSLSTADSKNNLREILWLIWV